jgi:DNA helicase-2/ATP-dependent DNA helicase PcrA
LAGVAAEVHWAQVHMVAPATYADEACAAGRRGPGGLTLADVADLYGRYEQEKARRGVLDLDDLVTRAAALFESDAEACAALRWRLHHLFVDEFQDLNPAQWRLLMAWLGDRSDLFVVGDPNQAIYAWNGSDPSLLQRLPDNLPGTVVVRLDDNHRCTPQICAAARAVLGSDEATCRASRPDGQSPVIKEFDDDAAEASAVAHWLRLSRRPGGPWSHLAVLARTHARLAPVADALRGAGIPFRWAGAPGESGGRDDGTHSGALARLRRQPRARRVRSALAELVVADDVEACRDAHHGASSRRGGRALARLVDEHALELPDATVGDFLAWVAATGVSLPGADADEFGDGDADRYDDGDRYDDRKEQPDNVASHERVAGIGGVELSTFHRAKGLQWPAVAVVGLERGLMPIAYASTPDAWAEERRLLYVAITRAEDDLWCSWARTRHAEDRSWDCDESPFLDALSSAVDREPVRKAGTAGVSRHLRLLRARLASTG